jgi:hypothetical protein
MKFTRISILFFYHLLFVLPLVLGFAIVSSTDASEKKVVDIDHDGLIEISTLQQLDEIRNDLYGSSLSGISRGCPDKHCRGYELVADLDFDTNGNGIIDERDEYWNGGAGWLPIGDRRDPFYAVFEGNNHKILNLYINRGGEVGLFGAIYAVKISNLTLSGKSMSVSGNTAGSLVGMSYGDNTPTGRNTITNVHSMGPISGHIDRESDDNGGLIGDGGYLDIRDSDVRGDISGGARTGGLIGSCSYCTITDCSIIGTVTSETSHKYAGGLVGHTDHSTITDSYAITDLSSTASDVGGLIGTSFKDSIENCFAAGTARGNSYVGGLVGNLQSGSKIRATYAVVEVSGLNNVGGLVGVIDDASEVKSSYWATDTAHLNTSAAGTGVTLAELRCPTAADNSSCSDTPLFVDWGEETPGWDFGTSDQLPGLILGGTVHRDSDADGYEDGGDAFPLILSAHSDNDGDGHPDGWRAGCDADCINGSGLTLDNLPHSAAAWQDLDLDGYPDSWPVACDRSCQSRSGLKLDPYPDDSDNDGLNNLKDDDDNGDGVVDADADSDGLIDVGSLAELNGMRYNLAGSGQVLTENGKVDTSGCPMTLAEGTLQVRCHGYELTRTLDFDSNGDGVMDAKDDYWDGGKGWVPVGNDGRCSKDKSFYPFTATFEGNGFQILNLYIDTANGAGRKPVPAGTGLFGYTKGAVLRNIGLGGQLMSVVNGLYCGGKYDRNHTFSGTGSLVGIADAGTTIDHSYATGAVYSSYDAVGGLAGILSNRGRITSSYVAGKVYGSYGTGSGYGSAGGLVGFLSDHSEIISCHTTGEITGQGSVGGLAAYSSNSRIVNSYVTGAVIEGSRRVGGLVGKIENTDITGCFAAAAIKGEEKVGGLVGFSSPDPSGSRITACFATGSVTGLKNVGGLVGSLYYEEVEKNEAEITASYAVGSVTARNRGQGSGLVSNAHNITNSYWAVDTSVEKTNDDPRKDMGYLGDTLVNLQCPTAPDNTDCGKNTLYHGWGDLSYVDSSGNHRAYWDFGNANQLPGLNLDGVVYRDSDGDGMLDENDAFPFDHDNDGVADADDAAVKIPLAANDTKPAFEPFHLETITFFDASEDEFLYQLFSGQKERLSTWLLKKELVWSPRANKKSTGRLYWCISGMDILPRNNQFLELISVCRVDQEIIYTRDEQQLVRQILPEDKSFLANLDCMNRDHSTCVENDQRNTHLLQLGQPGR